MPSKGPAEKVVRDIRRKTRRKHSTEEKIRIAHEGLRGDESIAALCRREGIAESVYYSWSKEFLEVGKKRLAGDPARQATSNEVKALLAEARDHPPGRAIPPAGPADSGQAGHCENDLLQVVRPVSIVRSVRSRRSHQRFRPDLGPVSWTAFARRSSSLPCRNRNYRLGSWRSGSPTRSVTLSPKPPSIGS